VASALSGGGNVELGKFGSSPATILTGDFAGTPVTLSSLVLADWTANSNALAIAYITGAANSIHHPLTNAQMTAAVNNFFTFDLNPLPGPSNVLFSWQLISDPNVSDVNLINGQVVVALDGLLDATSTLNAMFGPLGVTAPAGSMASEVVKITSQGSTAYFYSFSCTPSGYHTVDGTNSYNGRCTIPEPASLALLGIGIAGLGFMRRRKA